MVHPGPRVQAHHPHFISSPHQCSYHKEIVEEEDFPLMQPEPLGAVWIWYLIELTAANQSTVGKRQDLGRHEEIGVSKASTPASGLRHLIVQPQEEVYF